MRILQLGKFYPIKGGVEKVMYELTQGLSEQDIDCDMMCAHSEKGSDRIRLNNHARLICSNTWTKLAGTMIAPSMIGTLRRECKFYDVIHIHCPDPMAAIALRVSGYKGKVVLHWHSDVLKQRLLLRLYAPLQNWLIKRADRIVCTTPVMRAESPSLTEVQDKTIVIPIGIEPMVVKEKAARSIRKQYKGKKIVFSLGRLVPYKGYTYLIEAAKYLPDDYVVIIGGSGPLWDNLQEQIQRDKLESKVQLMGFIANGQLHAYYGACDVFCMSSMLKTEAFGIVQIEAMSCGKPVVATNIGGSGVSWVNEHGVSGINVSPRDPKALADAIVAICSDKEAYERYSKQSLERYFSHFTRERMINSCKELYMELTGQSVATDDAEPVTEAAYDCLDATVHIRQGLKLRSVGEQYLIVDNSTAAINLTRVFEMNDTAAWIWKRLEEEDNCTPRQLIAYVTESFNVDETVAAMDVLKQIRFWNDNEMITFSA